MKLFLLMWVIKELDALWSHLKESLQSSQEVKVALGYGLSMQFFRFSWHVLSKLPRASITLNHPNINEFFIVLQGIILSKVLP